MAENGCMMNQRIERLPKFKGIPVPFFASRMKDGTPDFKITSEPNRERCAEERLCWICGEKLDYWIAFVGGPMAVGQGVFVDGPMHEECARDSLKLCPFLLGTMDYAAPESFRLDKHDEPIRFSSSGRDRSRPPPSKIGLYKTRGFDLLAIERPSDGWSTWLFKARKPVTLEWTYRVKVELPGPLPELEVILAALVHVAPDIIEQIGLEPSHCILSTAIAVDVLHRFGINAKPLSVRTIACNQVWRNWLDNDKLEGAMPEGAWAVAVTDNNPATGGWNGHAVAFIEEAKIVVDLNLGQFARPQKSICMPLAGVFRDFEAEDNNPHFYRINDTTTLCYDARMNDRSYELTPDWRKQDRYDPIVKKIVDFMIESLYTPNKMTAEERG